MYTQTTQPSIISLDNVQRFPVWLLREETDGEEFSEDKVAERFQNIHTFFLQQLHTLTTTSTTTNPPNEKELHFTLDALIQTKILLDTIEEGR
ncbi:MAG: hypothetical protein AAB388_03615 [Patescibacteria group bacterium]